MGEGRTARMDSIYPWGKRCLTSTIAELQLKLSGDTTAVGSYPKGASPYGHMAWKAMSSNGWRTGIAMLLSELANL